MRVVHLIENLDREYGGPAISVPHLAAALARQGIDARLKSLAWCDDERNSVIEKLGLPWERYALDGPRKLAISRALYRSIQPGQSEERLILHVHNLWNGVVVSAFLRAREYDVPLVISPRGSLYDWSLRQGRWRKRVAWALFQRRILDSAAFVHATEKAEVEALHHLGVKSAIALVPNGVDVAVKLARPGMPRDGRRRFLFMSRLHKKKGVDILLRAWGASEAPRCGAVLIVAGTAADPGYKRSLMQMARELCPANSVQFVGWLSGADKETALAEADVFVLPSHSENFGMAVAEALAHGVPVITTTGTPWREISEMDAGWWVDLSAQGITRALDQAAGSSPARLVEMGRKARKIAERYSWDGQARLMQEAYAWALRTGPRPSHLREGAAPSAA